MRVLSFRVGGEFFAVDVTLVEAVARKMAVTPVFAAPVEISGIANMKGKVVTVINLYRLLGYKEKRNDKRVQGTIDAVVFKSLTGGADLMALTIGKPGNLIDIEEKAVRLLSGAAGEEESFCVSKIVEVGDRLYRIVDIESIMNKYKHIGEKAAETKRTEVAKNDE